MDGLAKNRDECNSQCPARQEGRETVRKIIGGAEYSHALKSYDLIEDQGLRKGQDLVEGKETTEEQRSSGQEGEPLHASDHALVLPAVHDHHHSRNVGGSRRQQEYSHVGEFLRTTNATEHTLLRVFRLLFGERALVTVCAKLCEFADTVSVDSCWQ